jgi:hypothetical protein
LLHSVLVRSCGTEVQNSGSLHGLVVHCLLKSFPIVVAFIDGIRCHLLDEVADSISICLSHLISILSIGCLWSIVRVWCSGSLLVVISTLALFSLQLSFMSFLQLGYFLFKLVDIVHFQKKLSL